MIINQDIDSDKSGGQMTADKIFESYAENAFDKETIENSLSWKREWYEANFKKFFPKDLSAKLLDIGPGLGELLTVEKEWGYANCYAVDISPSTVQYCKKKGLNCEKTDDTAAWLQEHRESFELITLLDVFEHIPQDSCIEFLRACKEALRSDGRLILQVPNIQSAESFLHRYNDITHVFGYSRHTLEQLISVTGFEMVRFYPFEEYPGNDARTKMIRRLRSIYWKSLRAGRTITHNLNPEILTPELFAVLAKNRCELPEHKIEDEFGDRRISLKDINDYLELLGAEAEVLEKIGRIDELEKLLDEQSGYWDERFQWQNGKIEEQNGRLVRFVDQHMDRLEEHNVWTRQRLDYLEMKVEKIDHLLMKMRYPLRALRKKMQKQ